VAPQLVEVRQNFSGQVSPHNIATLSVTIVCRGLERDNLIAPVHESFGK
jgi:hypothetical protein